MNGLTLDAATLRKLLDYDQDTGEFTWRVSRGRMAKVGAKAGCVKRNGYIQIRIGGRDFFAHRLAWLHAKGIWPPHDTDHINGERNDNRIANLRLATRSQNQANRGAQANNTSGAKGVCWHKGIHKWVAHVRVGGEKKHLGTFVRRDEAEAAYQVAAILHFGPFARDC